MENEELKRQFDEELRDFRKKGWSETKIARWLETKKREISGFVRNSEAPLDSAWTRIIDKTTDREIRRRFKEDFGFRPSPGRAGWPSIVEPVPSVTYEFFNSWFSKNANHDALLQELQQAALSALRKAVGQGEACIAFDPYHGSFELDPYRFERAKDASAWAVPAFPNGEYSIFVTKDWRSGYFGHPWEETICIFGAPMVQAITARPPKLLNYVLRKDGKEVNPRAPRPDLGRQ